MRAFFTLKSGKQINLDMTAFNMSDENDPNGYFWVDKNGLDYPCDTCKKPIAVYYELKKGAEKEFVHCDFCFSEIKIEYNSL